MQMILAFIAGLGPWNWFILAVILFGLETVVPGVHFLWFGMAAGVAGALALSTGIAWQWQLVVFAVTAIAAVFLVRSVVKSDDSASDAPMLNERGHQYVGRVVIVEEGIEGGRGRVRVGDTLWSAEGPELDKGARVKVVGTRGTVLLVEAVDG